MLSVGYYGFRFVKPMQCVERFHCCHCNEKNIIASLLKLNKMAAIGIFFTFSKFCWPSRAKGIIGKDLKFAGYVPHYKILIGNIFGLILKNKMAASAFL